MEEPTPEPTPTPASTAVPTPTEVPVETGLAEANEKLKAVQSFHMDVEMNMDMDMVIAVADMKQSIPVDMDLPEDALKDMADMDMTVMIDEETGLPIRYTIDMTAAMNSLMAVILQESLGAEDMEGMAFTMDVSTAVLNVTLSRFDSIDPIIIPEAALNALEAE